MGNEVVFQSVNVSCNVTATRPKIDNASAPHGPMPKVDVPNQFESIDDLLNYETRQLDIGFTSLPPHEQKNTKAGIKRSLKPSPSQTNTVTCGEKSWNIKYLMLHNSRFRGWHYKDIKRKEQTVSENCVTSSSDRCPPEQLTCARVMKMDDNDICYAGRPDTEAKLKELVTMIFLSKLKKKAINPNADGKYDLPFIINSFISTFSTQDLNLKKEMPEYKLLEKELELISKTKNMTIKDEAGKEYSVKLDCKIFCDNFNFMNALERVLPPSISGQLRGQLISNSVDDLQMPEEKNLLVQKAIEKLKCPKNLTAEEKLFLRLLVCKECDIPIVLHCRSCVDRTTIGAAMLFAIYQWMDSNEVIPKEDPLSVLDKTKFKDLFYANIVIAHMVSHFSRDVFGFKWQTTPLKWFTQHPTILRLLPENLFKPFNFWHQSLKEMGMMWTPVLIKVNKSEKKYQFNIRFNNYFPFAIFFTFVSGLRCIRDIFIVRTPPGQKVLDIVKLLYIIPLSLLAGALSLIIMTLAFVGGTLAGIRNYVKSRDLLKKESMPDNKLEIAKANARLIAPLLLGLGAARAIFTLMPKRIVKPGTAIDGKPLFFGDKVASESNDKVK